MTADLEAFAAFAEELADAARAVSLNYFRTAVPADVKADASPVTVADREVEALLRERIEARFPEHGIYGEEHGAVRLDAEYVWVIDPIDGTKAFITGKPLFGTLIGLTRRGRAAMGVVDMPALGERWVGVDGRPTRFGADVARTRACPRLADAWLYATSPQMFEGARVGRFEALRDACRHAVYGGDCHGYGLLASGWVDVVCEASMSPYDYIALAPVIAGAGGVVTDWAGRPLGLEGDGTVIAVGDPARQAEILDILGG
ncbi:MAG: histidinol-phosphatase [Rhodospirillaceae bacterium]